MRNIITTTVALLTMLNIAAFAQQKGTFTDARDKEAYKTVKIGTQTWMAENLNYDPGTGNSACYENKPEYCEKYGRLYDGETAKTVCPKGWHLPSNAEWDKLYRYADGDKGTKSPYDSKTAGKFLKAKDGWNTNTINGYKPGTDKFGFSAIPGGSGGSGGNFNSVGNEGVWWTATEYNSDAPYVTLMEYRNEGTRYRAHNAKSFLYSVRCLMD